MEWNGEPRGYRVLYKVTSDDKFIATTPVDSLTIHKTHLLGLQEGLQYEVKMVAFNDVGEGPFSPLIMVKLGKYVATLCVNRNCLGQFREIPWNQTTDVQ